MAIVLLGILALIFYQSPKEQLKPAVLDSIYQNAKGLVDNNTQLNINKDEHIWWISPNNYNIWIPATGSLSYGLVYNPNDGIDSVVKLLENPNVKQFVDDAQSQFVTNGYIKNEKNSSKDPSDTEFYDYVVAYEKGNEKCTITVDPDASGPTGCKSAVLHNNSFVCRRIRKSVSRTIPNFIFTGNSRCYHYYPKSSR